MSRRAKGRSWEGPVADVPGAAVAPGKVTLSQLGSSFGPWPVFCATGEKSTPRLAHDQTTSGTNPLMQRHAHHATKCTFNRVCTRVAGNMRRKRLGSGGVSSLRGSCLWHHRVCAESGLLS